jgi:Tfp pilus assembly protein PilF
MTKRSAVALCALLALPSYAQVPQAVALLNQGRYEEAKKLVAPLGNDPEALDTLARIAMSQGDSKTASDLLEKAIRLKPNVALYHYHRAEALGDQAMKASIFAQASLAGQVHDEFEKAAQLDPNLTNARFGLIDFYTMAPGFMGGSEEKALAQAAEIKKHDAYQGHRAYSRVYQRMKKLDLARKEYEDFVREQPQSAPAHNIYGAFLAGVDKNYKAAFEQIDTAIKLDPAYMPAYFRLGAVAGTSGAQLARGEEALRKYLGYQPKENEPSLGDAHYWLGMVLEKEGKKAEAKQSYLNALRFAPASKQVSEALKRVS